MKSEHLPLISIVIPTLNAELFLEECLGSVMTQGVQDIEVMIVDGGSEDNTLEIAASHQKTTVFRQQSQGLAAAWNEGVRNSRGQYIAFLDSDDLFMPDALEKHLSWLKRAPHKLASIGQVQFFLHDPHIIPVGFQPHLLHFPHLAYMPGCFLAHKDIFDHLGLFETRWVILSDIVWFDQLKAQPELLTTDNQVVLKKRVHARNLSYTTASQTPVYRQELLQYMREKVMAEKGPGSWDRDNKMAIANG